METLFDDRNIVVIVKQRNILSQKSEKQQENVVDILEDMYDCEIFPVHRLDKPVGGVMVFAKNKFSASKLSGQITDGVFKKTYLTVVEGEVEKASDELTDLLYFDKQKNKAYVVKKERKGVKKALLDYKVIGKKTIDGQAYTLLEVHLHTGRTHQIRVQLASRKMPIVGDTRYGSKCRNLPVALWSFCLEINDVRTGERLKFSAVPPDSDGIFEKFSDEIRKMGSVES